MHHGSSGLKNPSPGPLSTPGAKFSAEGYPTGRCGGRSYHERRAASEESQRGMAGRSHGMHGTVVLKKTWL